MSKFFGEQGYLYLLEDILENGVLVPDRTGIGRIKVFDRKLVFAEEEFTHFSVRPCPPKMAFEEFWFMLNGKTQTKELEEKGIYFWKGNTSRDFLDNRGLTWLPEGDMGYAYGAQWRKAGGFGKEGNLGVDQLKNLLDTLENDKYSSRMVISLWNVPELNCMALTPCWWACQVLVIPGYKGQDTLHMKLINRSLDALFGLPFAVQQYRMFQKALADMFGFRLGRLSCDLTDVHIYQNQVEYVEETLEREDYSFQNLWEWSLDADWSGNKLDTLLNLKYDDFKFGDWKVNREKYITPRPEMAV